MTELLNAARGVLEIFPDAKRDLEHPAIQKLQKAVENATRQRSLEELATERAAEVASMVNTFSSETMAEYFVAEMARQHRTLQQNFTRLVIRWLEHLAKMHREGYYDLRNEASCHFAYKVMEALGDLKYLPHV